MGQGGYRPNAGRKSGVPNKSTAEMRALIDAVSKKRATKEEGEGLEQVVMRLFELADGVTVQRADKDGEEKVFLLPPSEPAARTILELRFGKARQSVEVDDVSEGPRVVFVHPGKGKIV